MNKHKATLFLRAFFLILSLIILIFVVDFELAFAYIGVVPWFILGFITCLNIFRTWLTGIRWQLLNPDTTGQLTKWHYFRFVMLTNTFNLIMPGSLGGDFVKTAYTLNTVKDKKISNVMAIMADRFIGLFSITLLGTIAFLLIPDVPGKNVFIVMFVSLYGFFVSCIFLLRFKPLYRLLYAIFSRLGKMGTRIIKIIKTWEATLNYYYLYKKRVLSALLICLPIHIAPFITTFILALYLGIELSFLDLSMISSLVWIITAIPFTISGLGIRELSLIYFLSLYGVSAEAATALSVYIYITTIILGALGFIFIVKTGERTPYKHLGGKA